MIATLKLLAFMELLQLVGYGVFRASLTADVQKLLRPADIAIMLCIPVVGLFGQSKIVFYLFLMMIPVLSIGRPVQLACRYVLVLPLFPELQQPLTIGNVYLGSFSAITSLNLGTLIALSCTHRGRLKPVMLIDICAWILYFMVLLMSARGIPLNGVIRAVITSYLSVLPPFYVMARCVNTREAAERVTIFFSFGALTNAVIAIFEAQRRWPLYQAFYSQLNVPIVGLSATLSMRAGMLRSQGAVGNPATLGLILGLALIAVIALRTRFRPGWRVAIMAALVLGAAAGQSRGAWIATAAGIALYLLYMRRFALLAGLAPVVALAVLVWNVASRESKLGALLGRSGHGQFSIDYRSDLLSRGMQEIARHPLTGQTKAQLEISMNDMRQGEHIIDFVNTHLASALIAGIGGLLLWMFAWCTPAVLQWRARARRAFPNADPLAGLPFAMIGACFVCLTFTSMIDRMPALTMASIGLAGAWLRLGLPRSTGNDRAVASRPGKPALSERPA